ncbi:hypothetical protein PFISCL1PPCAC_2598 [Pristionchus fissidentatus]|uniref:Cytochrome P450 n=1 Tax=Pristionchus fissidentatus TaxID=1538716 RepID=A0AAV5UXR3_9BILA|nr:hypothetical protein PFISCL1PPCAC_2598 [Pristionchus fissidentatus]
MAILQLVLITLVIIAITLVTSWKRIKDLSVCAWRTYYNLYQIPGPKSYPIIGSALEYKVNSADLLMQLLEWADVYAFNKGSSGLIKTWIGMMPLAVIIKPEYCKLVLESNTQITKAAGYDKLSEWIGTGLLTSTNEKWFGRRKMLTPAFHFQVLKGYLETFIRQSQIFLDQIDKFADTGREVDLFPYIKRCALDIICETSMATQVDSQIGKNSEYVNAVVRLSDMIFTFERCPWLWIKPVWYACGMGYEFDRLVELTTDFTRRVINERRQTLIDDGESGRILENPGEFSKKKMVFLDLMLLTQEKNSLSDEDIREEVDTFMFEGHDTTGSSMGFTVWFLGQHPEYQANVHAELDEIFGDDDREPTEADLKKCVYLEKCIKESLRLCPPVPLMARRLSHDLILDDVVVPKDLTVLMLPFGTHRDPAEWERPNEFYPAHFDDAAVAKRHPFAYFPFSAGPRNCIGQKFAMTEEKTLLSFFFRKYRVESVEPMPGNRSVPEVVMKPENGVKCHMFKRQQKN